MTEPEVIKAFKANDGTLHSTRTNALIKDCQNEIDDLALREFGDGAKAEKMTRIFLVRFNEIAKIMAKYNEAIKV